MRREFIDRLFKPDPRPFAHEYWGAGRGSYETDLAAWRQRRPRRLARRVLLLTRWTLITSSNFLSLRLLIWLSDDAGQSPSQFYAPTAPFNLTSEDVDLLESEFRIRLLDDYMNYPEPPDAIP